MLTMQQQTKARRHARAARRWAGANRMLRLFGGATVPGDSLLGTLTRATREAAQDHTKAWNRHRERLAAANRTGHGEVGHA